MEQEKNFSYELLFEEIVTNYPGFKSISGMDLSIKFFEHFNNLDVPLYNEEVMDYSPFNVEIHIDNFDEIFIKKNSRNIASTVASRIGSWKFPFVTVKPDIMLEKPGDFEIFLEKGGNADDDSLF